PPCPMSDARRLQRADLGTELMLVLLRGEGVEMIVRGNENAPVDGDRSREAAHQSHLFRGTTAREEKLAGLAMKRVEPIARRGNNGTHHRFRRAIRVADAPTTPS